MVNFVLPLGLCLLASSPVFGQVKLEILSHGFNGIAGFRRWIPVVVKITNQGASMNGQLQIRPADSNGSGLISTYDPKVTRPVDLPEKGEKIFVLTALMSSGSIAQVRLLGEDDELLASAVTNTFTRANRVALVLGRPGPVESAIRTKIGVPKATMASLLSNTAFATTRPKWLPEHWIGYDSVSSIFVYGESLNELRPQQIRALQEKVASGSTFVICYDGRNNFAGTFLEEMMPGRFGSEETVSETGLRIRRFEIQKGRLIQGTRDAPLIVERRFGAGYILVLTFDLNQPNLQDWSEWPHLAGYLLENGQSLPPLGYIATARTAASQFPELEAPSFIGIGFFLLVCVVVIGPANYLYLKSKNRKEWTLITVPALSIFFAVLSYFWTIIVRGGSSVIKRSSLIHLNTESDYARRDVWTGILSQSRSSSEFVPKTTSVNWKMTDVTDQYQPGNRTSLGSSFRWGEVAGLDSMAMIPEPLRTHMWSYELIRTADVVRPGRLVASLELTDTGLNAQIINRTGYILKFNQFTFGSVFYMSDGLVQVEKVKPDDLPGTKELNELEIEVPTNRNIDGFPFDLKPGHKVSAVLKPDRSGNLRGNLRDRSIHVMEGPYAQVGGTISEGDSPVFSLEGFRASDRSDSTFFANIPVHLTNETSWPHGSLQLNVMEGTPNQIYLYYHDPVNGQFQTYNFNQNDNRLEAASRHWYQINFPQRGYVEFECDIPANVMDWEVVHVDASINPNIQIDVTCWNPARKDWNPLDKGLSGEVSKSIDRKARSLKFRLSSNAGATLHDFTISLRKGRE